MWRIPHVAAAVLVLTAAVKLAVGETALCDRFVRPSGLSCFEYQVTTSDGYILSVQRVRNTTAWSAARAGQTQALLPPQSGDFAGPGAASAPLLPVLLLHALIMSSDLWFAFYPAGAPPDPLIQKRLPVALANAGLDVFLANHRGTEFSPGHVSYNTRDWQYWDWDFDQLAAIDLPLLLDLTRNVTGLPRVHLLGINQGAMLPFALGSASPSELSARAASVVAIAPIAYFSNVRSPVLRQWALNWTPDELVYQNHLLYGAYNVSATRVLQNALQAVGLNLLQAFVSTGDPNDLFSNITGPPCCTDPREVSPAPTAAWIASSYRAFIHYQQEIRSGQFQLWDALSADANRQLYGSEAPPLYYPSNMPPDLPTLIISGGNDWFADPPNIRRLLSALPNAAAVRHVLLPPYSHLDFLLASNAAATVHPRVLHFLMRGYAAVAQAAVASAAAAAVTGASALAPTATTAAASMSPAAAGAATGAAAAATAAGTTSEASPAAPVAGAGLAAGGVAGGVVGAAQAPAAAAVAEAPVIGEGIFADAGPQVADSGMIGT